MDQELDRIAQGKSDTKTALAVFAVTLKQTRDDVHEMKKLLGSEYATKGYVDAKTDALEARVKMLERIVYGAVGLILLSVFGALVALVVRN